MLNQLLNSVFQTTPAKVSASMLLLALATSLFLGLLLTLTYRYKTLYTKEFIITLTILPSLVAIIIFLVNGNLGTSVAVAGTFSLIRFRSAAGGARELLAIFMATAIGIATGMGFLLLAFIVTFLLSFIWLLLEGSVFAQGNPTRRQLLVTLPQTSDKIEELTVFLKQNCQSAELLALESRSKEACLQFKYVIELKNNLTEQTFIRQLLSLEEGIDISISKVAQKKKIL